MTTQDMQRQSNQDLSTGHDRCMDFADLVRTSLDAGDTPEQVAQALIHDHHLLPISAIKALRAGANLTSLEAKELIRHNLSAEQWAAAEPLWEIVAAGESAPGGDA
jgi:hypothetical protein